MSLQPTSKDISEASLEQPRARGSVIARAVTSVVRALPTFVRVLMGALLILSGWIWLTRANRGSYLADFLALAMDAGGTIGVYRPFLEVVVVPNVGLFALLVGLGEFLSGFSLFFGAASRLGAAVISFQFVNYGLMGGSFSILAHGILIALLATTVYWSSGRRFGVDRWLYRRWPKARIW